MSLPESSELPPAEAPERQVIPDNLHKSYRIEEIPKHLSANWPYSHYRLAVDVPMGSSLKEKHSGFKGFDKSGDLETLSGHNMFPYYAVICDKEGDPYAIWKPIRSAMDLKPDAVCVSYLELGRKFDSYLEDVGYDGRNFLIARDSIIIASLTSWGPEQAEQLEQMAIQAQIERDTRESRMAAVKLLREISRRSVRK